MPRPKPPPRSPAPCSRNADRPALVPLAEQGHDHAYRTRPARRTSRHPNAFGLQLKQNGASSSNTLFAPTVNAQLSSKNAGFHVACRST